MTRRGPEPSDPRAFRADIVPTLRAACADLSWLLSRGYTEVASVALVGDHFQLDKRQRHAIARGSCSDAQQADRQRRRVAIDGQDIVIDGFNTLIVLERAMAGGPVFVGRDGAVRDIGGVHGTYRTVEHTPAAVGLLRDWFADHGVGRVAWLLDRPVSNSGKLAGMIRGAVPSWTVELDEKVDVRLASSEAVVCSADSWVIDHCAKWNDLALEVIEGRLPEAWVIDLR